MSGGFADPYLYPGTSNLRNKLGLRSADALDRAERNLLRLRHREGVPHGDFDLTHLRAIHCHLFQDVYEWAGELRTVELVKGTTAFMPCRYIASGLADAHRRLVGSGFLRGLDRDRFSREAGRIVGDVNHVHPFQEGNGRTQLLYLKQLAGQAPRPHDDRRPCVDRGVGRRARSRLRADGAGHQDGAEAVGKDQMRSGLSPGA